jgi:sterol desaturase/sphingolipid hydroxylase (fatty acid hydroxylase superfamily)
MLESAVRLGFFLGILVLMAALEWVLPRRKLTVKRPPRWASNLGLVVLNTLSVRLLLPLGAVGMAALARERGWGLFNNVDLPAWLGVLLSVVALDLAVYLQHVMFHAVPLLWRLHMVHHADLDFDVTTGLRFHTLEILLSMGLKLAAVVLLGAPVFAVVLFEILLNATSMFNHANVRMPSWLDGVVRLVLVTPDMHRVHHSAVVCETNSNFGFSLPWWDFLFGTYKPQPNAGHERMTVGLAQFRDERRVDRLPGMLALPFVGATGNYPVNRAAERAETPPTDRRPSDAVA